MSFYSNSTSVGECNYLSKQPVEDGLGPGRRQADRPGLGPAGRPRPFDAPPFFLDILDAALGSVTASVAWLMVVGADWWASQSVGDPFGVRRMNRLQILGQDVLELCFLPRGSLTWQGRLRWTAGRPGPGPVFSGFLRSSPCNTESPKTCGNC